MSLGFLWVGEPYIGGQKKGEKRENLLAVGTVGEKGKLSFFLTLSDSASVYDVGVPTTKEEKHGGEYEEKPMAYFLPRT